MGRAELHPSPKPFKLLECSITVFLIFYSTPSNYAEYDKLFTIVSSSSHVLIFFFFSGQDLFKVAKICKVNEQLISLELCILLK